MRTLNIIGAGATGRVMARLFREHALAQPAAVINRSGTSAREAVAWIGAGQALTTLAAAQPADVWLLGCPDDAIAAVGQALAESGMLRAHDVVVHLSGALPSTALGCSCSRQASAHPVRSFADPDVALARFPGTRVAVEGDAAAIALLTDWIVACGGRPFAVDGNHKPLYHAASVVAANFPVVLMAWAVRDFTAAGVSAEIAAELAGGLAEQAVVNVLANGPARALTGPASRGDAGTIVSHLAALAPEQRALYRQLTQAAVALARRSGRLDGPQAERLLALLAQDSLHPADDPL